MTDQEIDAMQAGRNTDAIVADRVMGWSVCGCGYGDAYGACDLNFPPGSDSERPVPHYSTDIACAWLVVEKLAPQFEESDGGYYKRVDEATGAFTDQLYASFCFEGGDRICHAQADTLPLAICKAALRAVRGGEGEIEN